MKSSSLRYSGIAALSLAGLVALASFDGVVDSVHFYSRLDSDAKIDFGRAPIGVRMVGWTNEPERGGTINTSGWDFAEPDRWDSGWNYRQNRIRAKARSLEVSGDFEGALTRYKMLWSKPGMAAFVKDREELFRQATDRKNSAIQQYLRARYLIEFRESARGFEQLDSITNGPKYLAPHLIYAKAEQNRKNRDAAANAYMAAYFANRKSPRAESALIMAARSLLQVDPKPSTSSEQIAKGERILNRLLNEFPETRFRHNATGWLGRCALLSGNLSKAASLYSKQSQSTNPEEAWIGFGSLADVCFASGRNDDGTVALLRQWGLKGNAAKHIQGAQLLAEKFESLTPEQAKKVQGKIRSNPELLDAYIGFRIEHTELSPVQESNLMTFATSAIALMKNPPASLTSRVAQINYNAGRYSSAQLLARKALTLKGDAESLARARYVLAGSLARSGKYNEAIREGEKLLQPNVPGYLRQGAAEFLALQYERHGDPLKAMDIYIGLGYEYDAAFLADARLTPDQLKKYLARSPKYASRSLISRDNYYNYFSSYLYSKPGGPTRDALQYTLGMRYVRQEKYPEARKAFLKVNKETRVNWGMQSKARKEMTDSDGSLGWDKAPRVQDPILIVDKLEGLTRKSKSAKNANDRAQAIYDKAAYIYKERNLLFYSPALWQGSRAFMFDYFWNQDVNGPADKAALDQHLNEHECLAQSMRLCEELVQKYPKSPLVPKALYTAALSAERLSNLNTTWRLRGVPLLQKAVNRLDRLTKEYPNDPLAKPAAKYKREFAKMLAKPDYR